MVVDALRRPIAILFVDVGESESGMACSERLDLFTNEVVCRESDDDLGTGLNHVGAVFLNGVTLAATSGRAELCNTQVIPSLKAYNQHLMKSK
jgi:hypothetical protein